MNFTRFYTPATFRRITYSTEREDGVDRIKVPMILIEQRDGSGVHLVDARLAFHSRTPWHISKVLFLMQKYNLFQYTPNISNYNEHWNRPHVHMFMYLETG